MSFHLMEESALKAARVKLSLLVWKLKHFQGQFQCQRHRLESHFPSFTPFFHCNWSAKKDPNQHCTMKQGPATTNSTALAQLGTSAEWVIACLQTVQKTAQDCQKPSKFRTTPLTQNLIYLPQMHTRGQPHVCATT